MAKPKSAPVDETPSAYEQAKIDAEFWKDRPDFTALSKIGANVVLTTLPSSKGFVFDKEKVKPFDANLAFRHGVHIVTRVGRPVLLFDTKLSKHGLLHGMKVSRTGYFFYYYALLDIDGAVIEWRESSATVDGLSQLGRDYDLMIYDAPHCEFNLVQSKKEMK